MSTATIITLTDSEKSYIESLMRSRTEQAQIVQRARIVLLKSEGLSIDVIADKIGINRKSVMLCLDKFRKGGVENAIYDTPGRGRNPEITDDEKMWVINIACERPMKLGCVSEMWTYTRLTLYINQNAEKAGYERLSKLSRSSIKNILDEADIKPHKIRYYCERRDPEFEAKMHNVLIVYKQIEMQFDELGQLLPFKDIKINTLSYDEKPGIQAVSNTSADRMPTTTNGYRQRDYEYKRLGTISLLAGIDLLTGEAIPLISRTHKSSDFIKFLKILDSKYPKEERIRLILDNHSAHVSKETNKFLLTLPDRFEFIFTPKHGSWLNMIEGFFSKMTRQMLKGIRVTSVDELVIRIYQYFKEINETPHVFRWKYKMDEIEINNDALTKATNDYQSS
jgi:transposase